MIVSDDLDISPDFFEYFQATLPLLYKDNSIWCVSAYNDNGKPQLIDEKTPEQLYRTDFFPGQFFQELMINVNRISIKMQFFDIEI